MFEREYRELQFVPRWGIIRVNRRQSVAEHSYYVVLYAMMVADFIGWKGDRHRLAMAAAMHDLEECFMSDMPGPVKRRVRDARLYDNFVSKHLYRRFGEYPDHYIKNMDHDAKYIIKIADMIEECMYLAEEQQMGNSSIVNLFKKDIETLKKLILDFPFEESEVNNKLWVEVHTAIVNNMSRTSDLDFSD